MTISGLYIADRGPETGRWAADASGRRPEPAAASGPQGNGLEYSFHGCNVHLAGVYGRAFCCSRRAAAAAVSADPGQAVLMLVRQGPMTLRGRGNAVAHLAEGVLYLLNCAGPDYTRWSPDATIHLGLPRSELQRAFRGGLQRLGACASVDDSSMAPFLRSQMELLDRQAGSLGSADLASMFHICVNMALLLLGNVMETSGRGRDGCPALFSMALQSIETHGHRPNFDARALAGALGWSRSKLYRVFAEQDTTVNAVLREMRLERARRLIEDSSSQIPIGVLAYACGFTDHSSFGKMFRERYGVSPRRWRERFKPGGRALAALPQSTPPA